MPGGAPPRPQGAEIRGPGAAAAWGAATARPCGVGQAEGAPWQQPPQALEQQQLPPAQQWPGGGGGGASRAPQQHGAATAMAAAALSATYRGPLVLGGATKGAAAVPLPAGGSGAAAAASSSSAGPLRGGALFVSSSSRRRSRPAGGLLLQRAGGLTEAAAGGASAGLPGAAGAASSSSPAALLGRGGGAGGLLGFGGVRVLPPRASPWAGPSTARRPRGSSRRAPPAAPPSPTSPPGAGPSLLPRPDAAAVATQVDYFSRTHTRLVTTDPPVSPTASSSAAVLAPSPPALLLPGWSSWVRALGRSVRAGLSAYSGLLERHYHVMSIVQGTLLGVLGDAIAQAVEVAMMGPAGGLVGAGFRLNLGRSFNIGLMSLLIGKKGAGRGAGRRGGEDGRTHRRPTNRPSVCLWLVVVTPHHQTAC